MALRGYDLIHDPGERKEREQTAERRGRCKGLAPYAELGFRVDIGFSDFQDLFWLLCFGRSLPGLPGFFWLLWGFRCFPRVP